MLAVQYGSEQYRITMAEATVTSQCTVVVRRPRSADTSLPWAFVVLPKEVSDTLPRRGRTSVEGTINGRPFTATLEPDGQLSHWLRITNQMLQEVGCEYGDEVELVVKPVGTEPEPPIPSDFKQELEQSPDALHTWNETTTLARVDWIHWIESAKQLKTRQRRITNACEMLAEGKGRVCCFDPSGFYDKSKCAPEEG